LGGNSIPLDLELPNKTFHPPDEDSVRLKSIQVRNPDASGQRPARMEALCGWYAQPAQHSGIKIFLHQDDPVMTDKEVEALNPNLIIYQ
jgi:hypothetical protein